VTTHPIARFGIDTKRTRPGSPCQNGTAERWVGTVKRDLLEHVILFDESHLRPRLREYVKDYDKERVPTTIRDSPGAVRRSRDRRHAVTWSANRVWERLKTTTRGAKSLDLSRA
jgi:transposase InsO family protein